MLCDGVQHQDRAQRQLEHALAQTRVPHAYIFNGPDGVGKETLALALAAELLTLTGPGPIATHPAVHLIYRELIRFHPKPEKRKLTAREIGVPVIRQFIVEPAELTSMLGNGKIFIIREAHLMNEKAQNALLKTLEEPPDKTYFVLLTSRLDRLLETTLSRCQVVPFDSLPTAFVRTKMRELRGTLSQEEIEWYTLTADGAIGVALQSADDDYFAQATCAIEALAGINPATHGQVIKTWMDTGKQVGRRFKHRDQEITDTEALRRGLKKIFHWAANWYGDWLRRGTDLPLVFPRIQPRTEQLVRTGGVRPGISAIARLVQAEGHLDQNANPLLTVENLINDLARVASGEPAMPV